MILTCPACETQYFAEDSTIGESGRTVKCATCGHSWFVGAKGAERPASGAHESYRAKVRERKRRKSRSVALMSWLITASVVAVSVFGLYFFRNDVTRVWPQAATTYSALGFPVNGYGLDFAEAQAERFFDGTTPILEVRGSVQNISTSAVPAPRVRVTLLDDSGARVAQAFASITPSKIPAEAVARFATRIENPPFESFELELSFVPNETAARSPAPVSIPVEGSPEAGRPLP